MTHFHLQQGHKREHEQTYRSLIIIFPNFFSTGAEQPRGPPALLEKVATEAATCARSPRSRAMGLHETAICRLQTVLTTVYIDINASHSLHIDCIHPFPVNPISLSVDLQQFVLNFFYLPILFVRFIHSPDRKSVV